MGPAPALGLGKLNQPGLPETTSPRTKRFCYLLIEFFIAISSLEIFAFVVAAVCAFAFAVAVFFARVFAFAPTVTPIFALALAFTPPLTRASSRNRREGKGRPKRQKPERHYVGTRKTPRKPKRGPRFSDSAWRAWSPPIRASMCGRSLGGSESD